MFKIGQHLTNFPVRVQLYISDKFARFYSNLYNIVKLLSKDA